ncbi:MAG: glycosyltransferase, partial [Nitriliruptorales bacterium]
FVGRLERRKGLEQLVRAFVRVKRHRPTVRLLVVGDGPERARCQQLLTARLRADVLFLGRVDEEDLPRFHASADLYVAPNLGGESFGIVLLEAMAAGLPVVASDIPGFRSVIRDGVEGRLVPPGNVAALAEAIDALLANPALRDALAEQAATSAERYDWPVVVDDLRRIYQRVLVAS